MGYVVTAPLIQARTVGGTFVHVYEGGNLPDDQDPVQLEQLIAGEMVEESAADEAPAKSKPTARKSD